VTEPSLQQQAGTWDAVAPTYAEDARYWSDYIERALQLVPVGPGERVLDVACGPGTLAFLAAARGARVDAVDFSPGMVDQVTRRAASDHATGITAAVMDAQALTFPDATFDAGFCMFAFFFLPDRARAFAELRRVVRGGGRALIATWAPIDRRPFMKVGFEAFAEALPQMPRPAKGDLQAASECVAEMTAAGFIDVASHPVSVSRRVDSPAHYLQILLRSAAPLAVMKQRIPPAAWDAAMERALEAIGRRIPATGAELSAEALLTVGTRPV